MLIYVFGRFSYLSDKLHSLSFPSPISFLRFHFNFKFTYLTSEMSNWVTSLLISRLISQSHLSALYYSVTLRLLCFWELYRCQVHILTAYILEAASCGKRSIFIVHNKLMYNSDIRNVWIESTRQFLF